MTKEVRVAVLGAALFTEQAHVPGINDHPQGRAVAIYSRSLERAREMAGRLGVPEATDDLDALLARPDIDAVTVVSTNDAHHPYTMAALRAGKHVLCEKPMALHEEQAAEMTREARKRGLVHQIAFTFRYTYCLQEMRRRVVAGEIGTPYFVEIQGEVLAPRLVGTGGPSWREFAARHGAGHLGEMGTHFIDTINFVCGPTSGFISQVAAVTHTVPRIIDYPDGTRHQAETLDLASFLVRTQGGIQGSVIVSRASPPPITYGMVHKGERERGHMGYVIVTGDRGALMATFTRGEVEALSQREPGGSWQPVQLPPEAYDGKPHATSRMMRAFVESILRGAPDELDATFDDGYRCQSATDAVLRAGASDRWEPVATELA